jgi:hypothetical protein
VQIFQDKEHRVTFGKLLQDRHEGFERFLALPLWGEVELRIVILRHRYREQTCKELNRLLQGRSILAERVFEFAEFLVRGLLSLEP